MKNIKYYLGAILLMVIFSMAYVTLSSLTSYSSSNEGQLSGAFTLLDLAPKSFEYKEPSDLSKEAAQESIDAAEKDLSEMKEKNFMTIFPGDVLREAKETYQAGNYAGVFPLTQLIHYIKIQKIEFMDKTRLLEIEKQAAEQKGVTGISNVNELMQQAMNAFSLEQVDEANVLIGEAKDELQNMETESYRVQTLKALSRNYLIRYWWQILVVLVIVGVTGTFAFKIIRKKMLKSKISHLKLSLDKTHDLIKELQKECFVDKSITVVTYKDRAAKYEEKIAEMKRILPLLEAQLKQKNAKKKN